MKDITLYFPFYNQHEALKFNLDLYSSFDKDLRDEIDFLIVDDGSQRESAIDIAKDYVDKLNLSLYKIDVDIQWNMPEANNIAFKEAKTEWVIRTDIDHFLIKSEFKKLKHQELKAGNVYFFRRAISDKNQKMISHAAFAHENTYVLSKEDYWRIGGSNEYLSGNYGDDFEFRPRLFSMIKYIETEIFLYTIKEFGTGEGEVSYVPELARDLSINSAKAKDPNRPLLTFQNSYSKLI